MTTRHTSSAYLTEQRTTHNINNGYEAVIGASMTIEGRVKSETSVRIDGTVNGPVDVKEKLYVSANASVVGDIKARLIEIAGNIEGTVKGQHIKLLKDAQVKGDIVTDQLATETGAYIDGRVVMNSLYDDDHVEKPLYTVSESKKEE
jgi:cytoskeletal protein CcmA (bactofilin family)